MTISTPFGRSASRYIQRAQRTAADSVKNACAAALFLLQHVHLTHKLLVRVMLPGLATTSRAPRPCAQSAQQQPRLSQPCLRPAACGTFPHLSPLSSRFSRSPMISTASPTLTLPRSTRPSPPSTSLIEIRPRSHHERLVYRPLRLRNVLIHHPQQLFDAGVSGAFGPSTYSRAPLRHSRARSQRVARIAIPSTSRAAPTPQSNSSGSSIMSTLFKTRQYWALHLRANSTCSFVCASTIRRCHYQNGSSTAPPRDHVLDVVAVSGMSTCA